MVSGASAKKAIRTVSGRVILARPSSSRLARLVAVGVVGSSLCFTLTASARVGAQAVAGVVLAKPASADARSRLSVGQISVRKLHGRIVGTATIVNTGRGSVRPTTGSLGLSRGFGRTGVGVLTFSVPSLRPRESRTVRLRTGLLRRLSVPSGSYQVVVCSDIYSQVQRYARRRNCAPGPRLTISTNSVPNPSGPAPNTVFGATAASAATGPTASFGFGSSVAGSTFECSLDGGPWLACSSPQTYTGLVEGPHTFAVRSISPSGVVDPTPARTTWVVTAADQGVAPAGQASGSANATGTATVQDNKPSTSATGGGIPAAAPTTYSIGGTVFGLSGTLVLQDNGADNLTVTRNGSFTFATPIASGGAYNVTVKSSSSGQTCSVSGGAGTVGSSNVTSVVVTCTFTDAFNRADGGLGTNWTPMSDGALSIASSQVIGVAGATAGDIRTGESYGSDQYSQIETTATQLTNGEWVGPTVRSQNGGQDLYAGIYFWNYGDPQLRLYKRTSGNWYQLGPSYESGPLPAGTQLTLGAVGSQIIFAENGTDRISAIDGSVSGGAPGIMTYGAARADNWVGGTPRTYSIGGTVSGLSGSLVLQNNGGDDLTVNSNGGFTFATQEPDGASYNITFKTSPSGQTCTTTGAGGTVHAANVSISISCAASTSTSVEDNFNRADGGLGAGWAPMSDGGLSIASDQILGTAGLLAGDIRNGESYGSDQYSQVETTSTQLSGGQWVGPAVRSQNGGQDLYLGIYFWNNGDPQLQIYKRTAGAWTQLGNSYSCGALPAGTKLTLSVVGSHISLQENGTERIGATDTSLTGGAPGIMTYGAATAGAWAGGIASASPPPPTTIVYRSTDANGVAYYDVNSPDNGYGTQTLRVLAPTHPAPGVSHNFLYVLPVEPLLGSNFGDGLETLAALDAQDRYNLTIVEPTFAVDPWYADNPNDSNLQYETFMTKDLVPWVARHLSVTGSEQNWLIGFSKSGLGAQDLLLKHPDLFSLAASWDFPADMSSYADFGSSSEAEYGTDANFQANYRLSASFVDAHRAPFVSKNRIWIGGYNDFQSDISDYGSLLSSEGIQHSTETPTPMAHRWDSGWVAVALSALSQDSAGFASSP